MSIELNNKISDIKLVFSLLNYQDDARPHKHKNEWYLGSSRSGPAAPRPQDRLFVLDVLLLN